MSDTSAAAIAALMDGVTKGPWVAVASGQADDLNEVVVYQPEFSTVADADGANATFIAAARDLVPALSAEITALRAERDKWQTTAIAKIEMVGITTMDEMKSERDAALARVAVLEKALHFYADFYENPNCGPWGINSNDFGQLARTALAKGETL